MEFTSNYSLRLINLAVTPLAGLGARQPVLRLKQELSGQEMVTTHLWASRHQAETALGEELKRFADLLSETFAAVDHGVTRLERLDHPFGRVCALVLIKARNLGLGCYSLSLDALGQEAGALFRPLIECIELLVYFRLNPLRINEALDNRLPKAGVIAHQIEGKFEGLREYLNTHASHLSLSPEAVIHLVDFRSGQLRPVQVHNTAVLRQNLRTLLAVLILLPIEAANCISVGSGVDDHAFGDTVEDIKRRVFHLFDETTGR